MTPILGKDVVISFNTGSGYFSYACATEISMKITTSTKSVKTEGDGYWEDSSGEKNAWGLSVNGLTVLDGSIGVFDLLTYQMQMLPLLAKIIFTDSIGAIRVVKGTVLVVGSDLQGPSTEFATGSVDMQGKGAPTIESFDGVCNSLISNATLTGAYSKVLTFTANSDTSYITYEVFYNGVSITTGNVYSTTFQATFTNIESLGGTYHVVATPYCVTDEAGPVFTKDF